MKSGFSDDFDDDQSANNHASLGPHEEDKYWIKFIIDTYSEKNNHVLDCHESLRSLDNPAARKPAHMTIN